MTYLSPRIALSSTVTQGIAVANTPQVITFNITDSIRKITQTSTSRFTIIEGGVYLLASTPQINLGAGASQTLNIWPRINGVDVANSNNRWNLVNSNSDLTVPTLNNIVLNAGDFIELWMSSTTVSMQLLFSGAIASAPATPSIIMVLIKTS
jgi:hypothetical protein